MRHVLVVALLLLGAATPAAHANGDPASDVLLTQDSYLPYAPPVQEKLKEGLESVLAEARRAGFPMKVALIVAKADLGAYPNLFNRPQEYANLLTRELGSLNPHGDPVKAVHLLVVMPGGFGGNNLGDDVDEALAGIEIQGEAQSDGLAKAAVAAVARVATANGHPVKTPAVASIELKATDRATGGGGTSPLVFAAPALLLFAGLALAGRIQRRRGESSRTEAPGG